MMKILILPAYEYPEEVASSHLARGRNAAFVKNNAQIDIVAPSPCRGLSEEDYIKYKKIRHESFEEGRINIYRFPMYREGRNPILRAVRYSLCWFLVMGPPAISHMSDQRLSSRKTEWSFFAA